MTFTMQSADRFKQDMHFAYFNFHTENPRSKNGVSMKLLVGRLDVCATIGSDRDGMDDDLPGQESCLP